MAWPRFLAALALRASRSREHTVRASSQAAQSALAGREGKQAVSSRRRRSGLDGLTRPQFALAPLVNWERLTPTAGWEPLCVPRSFSPGLKAVYSILLEPLSWGWWGSRWEGPRGSEGQRVCCFGDGVNGLTGLSHGIWSSVSPFTVARSRGCCC